MSGCHDWLGTEYSERLTDPIGSDQGTGRVLRGDSWGGPAASCRSANRGSFGPANRVTYLGFRLALNPSSEAGQPEDGASDGTSIGRGGSPTDREP